MLQGTNIFTAYADHTLLPPGKYITMCVSSALSYDIHQQYLGSNIWSILRRVERSVNPRIVDPRFDVLLIDSYRFGEPLRRAELRQWFHEPQSRLRSYPLELQKDP
jgi:hypothetical protein